MKINSINYAQAFFGKDRYVKEYGGELVNGNYARIRINLNPSGNPRSLECYSFNQDGRFAEGKGIGRNPKLNLSEVINFLNDIKKCFNDCDIFAKFADVMSH